MQYSLSVPFALAPPTNLHASPPAPRFYSRWGITEVPTPSLLFYDRQYQSGMLANTDTTEGQNLGFLAHLQQGEKQRHARGMTIVYIQKWNYFATLQ